MKGCTLRRAIGAILAITSAVTPTCDSPAAQKKTVAVDTAQVPNWSPDDLNFFLHGFCLSARPIPVFQQSPNRVWSCYPNPNPRAFSYEAHKKYRHALTRALSDL